MSSSDTGGGVTVSCSVYRYRRGRHKLVVCSSNDESDACVHVEWPLARSDLSEGAAAEGGWTRTTVWYTVYRIRSTTISGCRRCHVDETAVGRWPGVRGSWPAASRVES